MPTIKSSMRPPAERLVALLPLLASNSPAPLRNPLHNRCSERTLEALQKMEQAHAGLLLRCTRTLELLRYLAASKRPAAPHMVMGHAGAVAAVQLKKA